MHRMLKRIGGIKLLIGLTLTILGFVFINYAFRSDPSIKAAQLSSSGSSLIDDLPCILEDSCSGSAGKNYRVASGDGMSVYPIVCYDRKLIMSDNKHNVGRGLNIVFIDDKTKEVKKHAVYDTFETDIALVEMLLSTQDNWIIMVACFDECAQKLSTHARNLLQRFGSGLVKELQYRDAFVMLGQKGLQLGMATEKLEHKKKREFGSRVEVNGCMTFPRSYIMKSLNDAGRGLNVVTYNGTSRQVARVAHFDTYAKVVGQAVKPDPLIIRNKAKREFCDKHSGYGDFCDDQVFMNLEYPSNSNWARVISVKLCMPTKIVGQAVKPDPLIIRNKAKREFCDKHSGYGDFCDESHIDEGIYPAPLTNKSWENHAIFQVPIAIIAGPSAMGLRMTLETVMMQPGISPTMVVVGVTTVVLNGAAI
ncbi:PREDICTED: uncharacterized protein LOC106816489 [Priapulus caudatus]|uniref:Uncharacterized protein LOC106816489 n=1 Tax=Priapulus caudatus TaxID=37621 RepID=A0ABM1EWM9_PRICU|nr:PREDICTED: uncharacterized protein LOC106816489 [Priapulus caudatus]